MNAQPSKEKLSQCKLFTRFIEKEQILIEETGKEKSQLSPANLGLFAENRNSLSSYSFLGANNEK
ncbi:hypothetical protein Lwal_1130 [Legionella waltersii]|uniref:Uncharacterized protein n=1 Tax=Legionella waltersii TaxID=66969 RepID=A0A0W1AGG9_9GAMM|nr:hypothetical protein Lwal_1130 [Legionella waltersii]SNV10029.1 Uncharacterised protein [Legionella waltersii]